MERSVEIFVVASLFVVGLSHALRAAAWHSYFAMLKREGDAGIVVNGLMTLWFGAFVVAFHDVWSGPAMIVTLFGWAQLLKGAAHLCIPGVGARSFGLLDSNAEKKLVIAGAAMSVFAVALGALLFL